MWLAMLTMCDAPLDVLCDLLPVFEPVEQLVCLDINTEDESLRSSEATQKH